MVRSATRIGALGYRRIIAAHAGSRSSSQLKQPIPSSVLRCGRVETSRPQCRQTLIATGDPSKFTYPMISILSLDVLVTEAGAVQAPDPAVQDVSRADDLALAFRRPGNVGRDRARLIVLA